MATPPRRPLPDSAPRHLAGAVATRSLSDRKRIEVTIVVRPDPLDGDHPLRQKAATIEEQARGGHIRLSRREFERLHRAPTHHIAQAVAFAEQHGLKVREVHRVRRDVVVAGSVKNLNAAFGINLARFEHQHGTYRAHSEPIHLPAELHGVVEAVLGLDEVPVVHRRGASGVRPDQRLYLPQELAEYYQFPTGCLGRGQRIAILSFGGGFHSTDLDTYFKQVAGAARPRVRAVSVNGARNSPLALKQLSTIVRHLSEPGVTYQQLLESYSPEQLNQAIHTMEATMDVELAGALAPGAAIDVICAPNDARGYRTAILAALGLHSVRVAGVRQQRVRAADVISISWGAAEASWRPDEKWTIHWALKKAMHKGVTVCCASGDFGSRCTGPDEETDLANVSFPASSPYALACGGTSLMVADDGVIADERAWNAKMLGLHVATGGGVSGFFKQPLYQSRLSLPRPGAKDSGIWVNRQLDDLTGFAGRGVPDVAANAAAETGYRILVGGVETVGSGTSAAAPVWAALLARLGERASVGFINALLYDEAFQGAFRQVLHGTNNVNSKNEHVRYFRARPGWNACDGLGTPVGDRLLASLLARGDRS